jgi:threonine/homoserine/homoserine lactone efflux protein
MWLYFIAGVAYGFAAGAQPGPLNAYLLSVTLRHGFRRALPATFAPVISDAFIIALTLLILTRIPFALIRWLHLMGGGFVLYLAWDAWRTFRNFAGAEARARSSAVQSVWKAAVINLLNPNPYLGWSLVLGPMVLRGWHSAPRDGVAIVVGFYGALVGTTILIVLLFDFARNSGPHIAKQLVAVSAIALAAFGLYQLWLGAAGAN